MPIPLRTPVEELAEELLGREVALELEEALGQVVERRVVLAGTPKLLALHQIVEEDRSGAIVLEEEVDLRLGETLLHPPDPEGRLRPTILVEHEVDTLADLGHLRLEGLDPLRLRMGGVRACRRETAGSGESQQTALHRERPSHPLPPAAGDPACRLGLSRVTSTS